MATTIIKRFGQRTTPGPAGHAGGDHYLNFIEAVRARDKSKLNGPVETAHLASGLAHIGNIAYRLGRTLKFDPKERRIHQRLRSQFAPEPSIPRTVRAAEASIIYGYGIRFTVYGGLSHL